MYTSLNSIILEIKVVDLLVVVALISSVLALAFVLYKRSKTKGSTLVNNGVLTTEALRMPQGLFFSKYHTWAYLERSGAATVGLDDLLVHITGEISVGRVLAAGDKIRKGDFLAELVQKDKTLRIYSPIAGEVLAVNPLLSKNPEIINSDPYQKGWVCKIKPFSWVTDIQSCFLAEDADMWARQELTRFKDFLAETVTETLPDASLVALQDGGELRDHPLYELSAEIWNGFQNDFLNRKRYCRRKEMIAQQENKE